MSIIVDFFQEISVLENVFSVFGNFLIFNGGRNWEEGSEKVGRGSAERERGKWKE